MRRLAVMVAMVALILAAAVPAFAASTTGGNVRLVDADRIQAAATGQFNVANDQRLAGVEQDLSVDQSQVSAVPAAPPLAWT